MPWPTWSGCKPLSRLASAKLDPTRTLVENGTVAFWARRQLHETLIHLWDLRTAGGLPLEVADELWVDTVDEAVTVMHPRQVRLGRAALPAVRLRLRAAERSWLLLAAAEPAAIISGPAEVLALLVWGRTSLSDPKLRVDGDDGALRRILTDHFVP